MKIKEQREKDLADCRAEINKWKDASGLERGGDPDGVTPDAARNYWVEVENKMIVAQAEVARLREALGKLIQGGTVAACQHYHNQNCSNCPDFSCGDNTHPAKKELAACQDENKRLRAALAEIASKKCPETFGIVKAPCCVAFQAKQALKGGRE